MEKLFETRENFQFLDEVSREGGPTIYYGVKDVVDGGTRGCIRESRVVVEDVRHSAWKVVEDDGGRKQ